MIKGSYQKNSVAKEKNIRANIDLGKKKVFNV